MRKVHVLVAEDDDDHRFLTMHALRRVRDVTIEVDGVRDGAETLDFVYGRGRYEGRSRPDLLVLDLKMPLLDGFGVLEQLKGDPDTASMPIVVLSSSNDLRDVGAAYLRGTNAYMVKPTSAGGYRERIAHLAWYWARHSELPPRPELS